MSQQTHTSTQSLFQQKDAPPNPSEPNTPEWFYNEIMRFIEPDLILEVIPLLHEFYKDETVEEERERIQGYEEAFHAFDDALEQMSGVFYKEMRDISTQTRKKAFSKEEREKKPKLQHIEHMLDSDPL